VLRYGETEFRSIRPQKSSRGQRDHSRRDFETLNARQRAASTIAVPRSPATQQLRDGGIERASLPTPRSAAPRACVPPSAEMRKENPLPARHARFLSRFFPVPAQNGMSSSPPVPGNRRPGARCLPHEARCPRNRRAGRRQHHCRPGVAHLTAPPPCWLPARMMLVA